jgi:hypothetical protein
VDPARRPVAGEHLKKRPPAPRNNLRDLIDPDGFFVALFGRIL